MQALILRLSGRWAGFCRFLFQESQVHRAGLLRLLILLGPYTVILGLSRWMAYQLRYEFAVPADAQHQLLYHSPWIIFLKLSLLYLFGQYSGLLSYFSLPDLRRLIQALMASSVLIYAGKLYLGADQVAPTGVIAIDFVLSVVGLTITRLSFRMMRERYMSPRTRTTTSARRVGIIGAGDAGAMLARELLTRKGLGLTPSGFFDDDPGKWRSAIHNIRVLGAPEMLLEPDTRERFDEVIIAMPSAPAKRIKEVVAILNQAGVKFQTVPSLEQLATGEVRVSQLRKVEIQDLLGRAPVQLKTEEIQGVLKGRVVMVTGAGGSIGSELCRQIASYGPRQIVLIERAEGNLFQIEQNLISIGHGEIITPVVADILDPERMSAVFEVFHPDVVFHAAAHKHVPMMESQPGEAFKNNTLGTVRLAELSEQHGVERFVMISTDKAINPTNVMGTTKRLAERYLQALYAGQPKGTRFMAVRFGNVLGSSGSVVPTFNQQIAAGGPVTVTHPDVTRYFMTISEAAGLVLQSAALGEGGEIFVLDMGSPVKIVDLARNLIELNGFRPYEDIDIEFVGLRPGEKLYEELCHVGENITPTPHPKIMRFVSQPEPLSEIREKLESVARNLHSVRPKELKLLLSSIVPEYKPFLS